jgi:hypothetical protein
VKQALHIFRKDVGHQWIGISVSVALLCFYGWRLPAVFLAWATNPTDALSRWLLGLALVCVCVSWVTLIARAIQDESLVGDRLFWVTRPYERKWLFAAKAVFVLAFVNLPVAIFDGVFLAVEGFHPWRYLAKLLLSQVQLTVFLILPTAALAVVTATLGQFLLALLGVGAYVGGVAYLASVVPSASAAVADDVGVPIALLLPIGAALAAIIVQYFRREAWPARAILLGTAAVVPILLATAPYRFVVDHSFPQVLAQPPNPAGFTIDAAKPKAETRDLIPTKTVPLSIPLRTGDVAQGHVVAVEGVRIRLQAPGGAKWDSAWTDNGQVLWPGRSTLNQQIDVSSKFYSSARDKPVDMQMWLALHEYRETNPRRLTVTQKSFFVTDDANCTAEISQFWEINCKSADGEPAFAAHMNPSTTMCPAPDPTWPSLNVLRNNGNLSDEAGDGAGLFPVQPFNIDFGELESPDGKSRAPFLCPGTTFEIATLESNRQYQIEAEIHGIYLRDYRYTLEFSFRR